MRIKIPYDGQAVELDFPDDTAVIEAPVPNLIDDREVERKIKTGFAAVRDSFSGKKITVIVNDATRRLPTLRILKILLNLIPSSTMEIIVATGTHRAPTGDEVDVILGEARPLFEGRIYIHDCYNRDSLIHLGVTSRNTPVLVNKKLREAECVIAINSVEPHFFAGFTGGRKSFIPGLAGFETIVQNHSHAKSERARSLNLDDNPVHLDLEEAINLVKKMPVFSIQLVCSRQGEIVDLFCGDLQTTFAQACICSRTVYAVNIENKYDIVFAVGEPPLDINLYQLQKGQEHGAEAVADGGILIVVGACPEGIGSPYFIKLAAEYPDPQTALASKALQDNRFGIHKLVKTARRLRRIKVWYVTKVDDNTIRKVYYEPKGSLHAALTDALTILGKSARVAILRDACFIVPTCMNFEGGIQCEGK